MKPENKLIPVKRWYHLAKGERGKVVPAFKDLHGHGDLVVLDAGSINMVHNGWKMSKLNKDMQKNQKAGGNYGEENLYYRNRTYKM